MVFGGREYPIPRSGRNPLKVKDAAVLNAFNLPRGYWEAKDEKDDLKAETNKKFAEGWRRCFVDQTGFGNLNASPITLRF